MILATLTITVDMPVPATRYRDMRSGLDIVRVMTLGAKMVMIGRPWVYALAAR